MSSPAPRFAMLAALSSETSSEGRRELLRKVTEALEQGAGADLEGLDRLLREAAQDYSVQVRADLARLVAANDAPFVLAAQGFALDEIAVAEPVLKHSRVLTDETLLKVIEGKSQRHLLAVTGRPDISPAISHALVARGDDRVVSALLANDNARIGAQTFDAVARRAQDSAALQAPLVRRRDVPLELLNELYLKVETGLRREILGKFADVPGEEVEKAFRRSRDRVAAVYGGVPEDMRAARQRVEQLRRQGALAPPVLVGLLREGPRARTAFMLAFADLADVEFALVQRSVEGRDLDTIALLCRGANFARPLFVALAIALDGKDRGLGGGDEFGRLYESVPVAAAQRAIRFWKVRATA